MGTVQRIDTEAFDESISSLANAVSAFSSARTSISNSTSNLLNDWQGDSKDEFEYAYDALSTALADEEENLNTIKDDLTTIKESYTQWDDNMSASMADNGQ